MQPLRNIVQFPTPITAPGTTVIDLPVNPLYCVYLTLVAEQTASTTTADDGVGLLDLLQSVPNLQILFRGSIVVNASLTELWTMAGIMTGRLPFVQNFAPNLPTQFVSLCVPIYLGRANQMGNELFPATRKGELQAIITFAGPPANTTADTFTFELESYEILDATPKQFLKYGALTKDLTNTGDNDFDLPMGNPQLGTLLNGEQTSDQSATFATFNRVKLLVDNVEYFYAQATWQTLQGELIRRLNPAADPQSYTALENLAAAYAPDVLTARLTTALSVLRTFAYLDYNPWDDDTTLVQTANRGRVNLRITITQTSVARVIPLEIISVGAPVA